MKRYKKHFFAFFMLFVLLLSFVQGTVSQAVYETESLSSLSDAPDDDQTNEQTLPPSDIFACGTISDVLQPEVLSDLPGEQFYVAPTGTCVNDVLSGSGSYFSETHNLYTCTGSGANRIAAYCLNPARTSPTTETAYREYENSNLTSFMTDNKSAASAVMMYGYGGESSINNDIVTLAEPNKNIGGSYGIYVIDGKALYGLLINGVFYNLDCLEAQAVTAAAIHKLNGSDITQITEACGNHNQAASDAFWSLYHFGSWCKNHIIEYGYDATYFVIDANTKPDRHLYFTVKAADGTMHALSDNYFDKAFDWTPYITDEVITFNVTYTAKKCESKLMPSVQTGTSNHISFTHDSMMEFPWEEYANGYYDYFIVREGANNTVPVNVTYHALRTEEYSTAMLGAIAPDGAFSTTAGQLFTQTATITVPAASLADGNTLDLSVYAPPAASFTPFYGDGDDADGYYNSGRFFYSSGYQDMVLSSPYDTLPELNAKLLAQTEKNVMAAIQLMKYSKTEVGSETPLQGAGFMACNLCDLTQEDGVYTFDCDKAIPLCSDGSRELFTDENGYAKSILLPEGQYLLRETTVPKNHFPVDDFIVSVNKEAPPLLPVIKCVDEAFEAYVSIYKIDAATKRPIKNNPAVFRIWSYALNSYVNFSSAEEPSYLLSTDADGFCKTPCRLPAGSYRLEEFSAPSGYYCPTAASIEFTIDADTEYISYEDASFGYEFTIENMPIYGMVELHKLGEKRIWNETTETYDLSEIPLAGICFDVIAADTIYAPDESNLVLFEKDALIETITTDADGYSHTTVPLPFGSYRLHEHPQEGYVEIDDVSFSINREDISIEQSVENHVAKRIVKTFTIHNKRKEPTLETSATNIRTYSKIGEATTDDFVSDTVRYTNLEVGNSYTLRGILIDKATKQPLIANSKPVMAEVTFICESTDGEVALDFHFDSSSLAGREIVLYDRLYYNGEIICVHENPDNAMQTIKYKDTPPSISPPVDTPPNINPPVDTPPDYRPPNDVPPETPPNDVPPETPPDYPKTGDTHPILPTFILCFSALLSFLILLFRSPISKFIHSLLAKF